MSRRLVCRVRQLAGPRLLTPCAKNIADMDSDEFIEYLTGQPK